MTLVPALLIQALGEYLGSMGQNLNVFQTIQNLSEQDIIRITWLLMGTVVVVALWSMFMRKY